MKTMIKCFATFLILSGISFSVFSQGTAMAVANTGVSATIVEPGSLTTDVGNGIVILSASVVFTPVRTRRKAGGLSLPVTTGSFTGAFFCVSGTEGYTFTINVPTSPLAINNGTSAMKITSFASEPALSARSEMIAGVYVSVTPFDVTVNYN
jgi:hypothetical protein